MSAIRLEPFPPFDPEAPAMVHDAELMIGGAPVPVTLWFAAAGPRDEAHLDPVRAFLADPEAATRRARAVLTQIQGAEETNRYIAHHRMELPEVLGGLSDAEAIAQLALISIALYPEEEAVAVVDFSLDPEMTDYRLAVSLVASCAVLSVEMVS